MNKLQTLMRVANRPQAILPDKAALICQVLAARGDVTEVNLTLDGAPFEINAIGADERMRQRANRGFDGEPFLLLDRVAVIEVTGTLLHRAGTVQPQSGATGYDGLTAQLDAALNHTQVRGILLDIDSPGGEVSGLFDFCDRLRAARDQIPIIAVVDDVAASAAYAIASQSHQIYANQTATVGSIGVITSHVDMSGALEREGLNITLLTAGAHKADGHPYGALPDDVRDDIQASLDRSRALFIDKVVQGRAGSDRPIKSEAVQATEARVYDPDEALSLGLIDAIAHPDGVLAAFQNQINKRSTAVNAAQRQGMSAHLKTAPHGGGAVAASSDEDDPKKKKDGSDAAAAAEGDEDVDNEDEQASSDEDDPKKKKEKSSASLEPADDPLAVAQLGAEAGLNKTGFALARAGLSLDAAAQVLAAVNEDRAAQPKNVTRGALAGALDTVPDPGVDADATLSADGTSEQPSVHPIVAAAAQSAAFKQNNQRGAKTLRRAR